ncbi:MAG TPA: FAD-dependent oxidoreductase [Acidimicrobiales bacterium]|nr:FAD-dependent oxidoreductase [Acidimicrobiales bacterium]
MEEQREEPVVIVGAGVGGLAAALAFARAGYGVTVLERDPLPATATAEEAFVSERRGAPQVHQTHGFLARLPVVLRERFPDVLDALLAAGCTTMPTTANLGDPRPGDEDLRVLIVRRTTFEWVLRKAVLAEPGVEVRTGVGVAGLEAVADVDAAIPRVTGVRLDDGAVVDAGIVIAATGRRGPVPQWVATAGADVPETVHESGLMYLSRWYRLAGDVDLTTDPKLGGDLGFVKYLGVPGDGGTLSVTLAIRSDDAELRHALSEPDGFDRACRLLPGPDRFFAAPLEPIGGVRPMGGLLNRLRRFLDDDGRPRLLGFHALGDAHTCTNPLYGRGCSLAFVQAVLLADAAVAHPGDDEGRAIAYESACAREVEPWFDVSVQMDSMGADPAGLGALGAGDGGPADTGAADGASSAAAKGLAAVFAAAATDPIIGRAIMRFMNLLATPADLMADAEFLARAAAVMADPDSVTIPPRDGPTRRELLEQLTASAAPTST